MEYTLIRRLDNLNKLYPIQQLLLFVCSAVPLVIFAEININPFSIVDLFKVIIIFSLFYLLHESIHYIICKLYGIPARFGMKGTFLYNEWSGELKKWNYLFMSMAPVILLSASGVIFLFLNKKADFSFLLMLAISVNVAGSFTDILKAYYVLLVPNDAVIRSTQNEGGIYIKK